MVAQAVIEQVLQVRQGKLFLTEQLVKLRQAVEVRFGVPTVVQYDTDACNAIQYFSIGTVFALWQDFSVAD